jgi:hypothetical protein
MSRSTFDRRLLWLAILPIAVYLLVYAVIDQARPTGIAFTTIMVEPVLSVAVAVAEAKLRYLWLSAFVLLTAVSLAIAASSALSLLRDTPKEDRNLVLGLVSVASIAVIGFEVSGSVDHWYVYMGEGLFKGVFSLLKVGSITALDTLNIGLEISKAATAVALLCLIACLIMTLAQPPAGLSQKELAEHLVDAIARQRTYLRHAALLYIFAILSVLSWMYWPMPFMADKAMAVSYKELLVGAAVLHGVAFSIGVAAIYLPPAMILRGRVLRLSGDLVDEGEAGKQIQATIATTPFDQLRQIAIMVAPALVSMLPALTDIFQVAAIVG